MFMPHISGSFFIPNNLIGTQSIAIPATGLYIYDTYVFCNCYVDLYFFLNLQAKIIIKLNYIELFD